MRDPVGWLLERLLLAGSAHWGPAVVSPRTPARYAACVAHRAACEADAWWFRTTKCQHEDDDGLICGAWRRHRGPHVW